MMTILLQIVSQAQEEIRLFKIKRDSNAFRIITYNKNFSSCHIYLTNILILGESTKHPSKISMETHFTQSLQLFEKQLLAFL